MNAEVRVLNAVIMFLKSVQSTSPDGAERDYIEYLIEVMDEELSYQEDLADE